MKTLLIAVMLLSIPSLSIANQDLFSEYNKDIKSDAQAHATNVKSAHAKNTTYRVKNKLTKGIVISNTPENNFNGFGNVEIEKGANVGNVIIETNLGKNNNIIFMPESNRDNF